LVSQFRPYLISLALLAFLVRILPGARTVDDAFITFRYSRNLVAGQGLVYNLGEKILGTTTPLYAGAMAILGFLFGEHYPTYALIVNALAGAVCTGLIFLLVYHFTQRVAYAVWVAGLWVIAPWSVTFDIGGMETGVHNAFMLGAWWAYLQNRPRWLGAMAALGVLTRPDALLWAVPLLVHQLWIFYLTPTPLQRMGASTLPENISQDDTLQPAQAIPQSDSPLPSEKGFVSDSPSPVEQHLQLRPPSPVKRGLGGEVRRTIPWQTWLTGLAIYLPWMIVATWYFGNPIPQTVSIKAVVYDVPATQALEIFLRQYATPFQDQFVLGAQGIMLGIFLYPALSLIGLRFASAKDRRALPIFLYPWLYFAIFVILNPLIFRWYQVPPLPAYFIAIGCGVFALLSAIPNPRHARTAFALIAALTLYFGISSWEGSPDHGPSRPAPQMAFHDLELNYQKMAKRLRQEHGLTDASIVAAADIGSFGYYSRAHILDTIGLVTEGTTEYYADKDALNAIRAEDSNYAIPPNLILDWQPDYVVVMEIFVRNGLLKDERFLEQYTLIEEIPTDYYGTGMLAFQRNPGE
jgi:hypothetical protein